jgi:rhodanese-related sulfurtransferase
MSESEIFLDVRTREEYEAGCIPNAIHIDVLNEDVFREKIQQLNKKESYMLYCRTENRSKRAQEIMSELGFLNIDILSGGYELWKQRTLL